MAGGLARGDKERASLKRQAEGAPGYRRAEEGKLEYLLQQPTVCQLEYQVGQILELVKLLGEKKKEKEKTRLRSRYSRNSKLKKRAAPPPEPRRSSRPKKARQL
jgi:hypothetical protein